MICTWTQACTQFFKPCNWVPNHSLFYEDLPYNTSPRKVMILCNNILYNNILFLWLSLWLCHIYCVHLLIDITDLHLLSFTALNQKHLATCNRVSSSLKVWHKKHEHCYYYGLITHESVHKYTHRTKRDKKTDTNI